MIARSYFLLTKPGILMGNALTVVGGYFLASSSSFNPLLFFATVVGLSLLIASSCVCNNVIDRKADAKMARTKRRAIASGQISISLALVFALILGGTGAFLLSFFTNLLTLSIALFGFLIYVLPYSFLKYYTSYGTLIGSVAGAVPPVVGYCAVAEHLDLTAALLFVILVLWQMPHFFAIAIFRMNDYAAAKIPVFSIAKGIPRTKIQILLYTIAFLFISPTLAIFGKAGFVYLALSIGLSLGWVYLAIQGFKPNTNDLQWARKIFAFSLLVITGLCLGMMVPTF